MEAVSVLDTQLTAFMFFMIQRTNMQMRNRNILYELHRFNSEIEDVKLSKYVSINSSKFRPIAPLCKILVCR